MKQMLWYGPKYVHYTNDTEEQPGALPCSTIAGSCSSYARTGRQPDPQAGGKQESNEGIKASFIVDWLTKLRKGGLYPGPPSEP